MEIVLIVAVLVVAAAVLYMTLTLGTRTRQTTAPLIDDAYKGASGQIDAAAQDLKRQIADGRQQDRDQLRQIQGHLDHVDSQASGSASQVLAELGTIRRLVEQLGARQDQLGADLGKLDQRVARLGESLGRPNAARPSAVPSAVPSPVPNAPADGPATVPGRLYAERLRFSIAAVQPEAVPSRPERRYRVQVERQVGALPGPQPTGLDPPAIVHRAESDAGFRERLGGAAADYFAAKPAAAGVTERWVTQNTYPETALVEVCNRISSGLETIVEKPLEKTGTQLVLPGPGGPEAGPAAGIGAALILQPVAELLAQAVAFLEITGAVIGTATGLHPLALAAAKMLAHDQFLDLVARRLREAARQVFDGPERAAHDQRPLRPVAPDAETRTPTTPAPTAPGPGTSWESPSAAGSAPTDPRPSQPPPEAQQPDPVHPDWWDDGPALGGPGAG